ncbi:MAG TPA: RES family NAD+ phosphorylase [Candidatus Sulfotelmatobacter sp.]|nr:RES family NAD+ phosphorylase [Candidatus Sulfotelmatobacter sp.]
MSSSCPIAPPLASPLNVETASLPAGTVLFRCHKGGYPANSFNPNVGKHIAVPEEGARFNPFPGAPAVNIPTIYAADSLEAAALESIFHDVPHVPSPRYPMFRLGEWSYSELEVTRDLVLLELINPRLRQFLVPGHTESITESELIHTPPSEYPHTRTWAQSFHAAAPNLDGLTWRPRLAGTGTSFVFFGDRFKNGDLQIHSSPTPTAIGDGFLEIYGIAMRAHIKIVTP